MEKFIDLLAEAIEKEDSIVPEDSFRNYEEWDSLAALALLAMINDKYDITIPRVDFDALNTIEDLYNKIMELQK
ncbi:MAG: phosphopantetheine-binding protein [Candidatus Cloacimonetes bacterium]|nr:phosphopantetheine-binding protein [Candidatus Cloacimonadota bacterium]